MTIRLSEKYGLNPSLECCYFCGKERGLVLWGKSRLGDAKAERKVVMNKEPCDECANLMRQGIMLISVRDGETAENPFRTGKIAVVTEEALKRVIVQPELADTFCKTRVGFIEDSVWTAIGLPSPEEIQEDKP